LLGLVILGGCAPVVGLACCLVARFPCARAIGLLDRLTGLTAPDTLAFRRYHQRLNRVAGLGSSLIGAWLLAYALTGFGHWLVTRRLVVLFWALPLGVPALLALPTWAVRLTRPDS